MDNMTAEQALDQIERMYLHGDSLMELTSIVRAALSAPRVPEGWVPVPVEPTDEMKREGYAHWSGESMVAIYKAMLAAAPTRLKSKGEDWSGLVVCAACDVAWNQADPKECVHNINARHAHGHQSPCRPVPYKA